MFRGRKMVARPQRAWIEPFVWFVPAVVALLVLLPLQGVLAPQDTEMQLLVTTIALGVLICSLLMGIVRPPWYDRLLHRLGVFKSARPNDMVAGGYRPDLPEHPFVPEHDRP